MIKILEKHFILLQSIYGVKLIELNYQIYIFFVVLVIGHRSFLSYRQVTHHLPSNYFITGLRAFLNIVKFSECLTQTP